MYILSWACLQRYICFCAGVVLGDTWKTRRTANYRLDIRKTLYLPPLERIGVRWNAYFKENELNWVSPLKSPSHHQNSNELWLAKRTSALSWPIVPPFYVLSFWAGWHIQNIVLSMCNYCGHMLWLLLWLLLPPIASTVATSFLTVARHVGDLTVVCEFAHVLAVIRGISQQSAFLERTLSTFSS